MIEKTLSFLFDVLSDELSRRFPGTTPRVSLSPLIGSDGVLPHQTENTVVITLVNVERESAAGKRSQRHSKAPLNLNLYVLFSANFSADYRDSLTSLSAILEIFQARHAFYPGEDERFPEMLQRLTLDLVDLDLSAMHSLWGSVGSKYMPSVLYKVRMLTLEGDSHGARDSEIETAIATAKPESDV